jgi:hypothetical protein
VWAADYGCFAYETPDCSGSFAVSKTSTRLEDFVKKEQSGT